MISNDSLVREGKFLIVRVDLMDGLHNWREQVCLEIVCLALDNGNEPFESHAGINVFVWQRFEGAAFFAVELGKDQVPHFGKPAAVAIRVAVLAFAVLIDAVVIENL